MQCSGRVTPPSQISAGRRILYFAVALLTLATQVHAQQPRDAGSLLRQQPVPPAAVPATEPIPGPRLPNLEEVSKGPQFVVKQFRFTGAVLLPEADLQARIDGYRNQNVTFGILRLIAEQLTGYYLEKGYLARVLLPEQEIKDGVVTFRVIEGQRGRLDIDNQGRRVDGDRVAGFINHRLGEGDAFSVARLDEAIAILNEQPGVRASTALRPGAKEGEVAVVVSTADKPLVSGTVAVNNNGSSASGRIQAQGLLTLSNPTGHFDEASLLVNASEGNKYARVDYGLAAGNSGLRLGANAAALDYRIISGSLSPLDLHGNARIFGLYANYPLARTRSLGLSLVASHDIKRLVDLSATGETGNREVTVTKLGIVGNLRHQLASRPALASFSTELSVGEGDERNAGALATDNASRRANGGFRKLSYYASNLVDLSNGWSHGAVLRGQFAGNNLDSTERLSLGGPSAIRGYPIGEATGDEGWILNLNLRRTFGNDLAFSLFYDAGGITLNHDTWTGWNAGNPNLPNRYTLAGWGVGLDWRFMPAALLSASLAAPVGSNPGRDINSNNADGRGNRARLSIVLSAQF